MLGRGDFPPMLLVIVAIIFSIASDINAHPGRGFDANQGRYAVGSPDYDEEPSPTPRFTKSAFFRTQPWQPIDPRRGLVDKRVLPVEEDMQTSRFVFPDHQQRSQIASRTGSPPICTGSTFCEDISSYPAHVVNEALKDDSSLVNYANIDSIDITQRLNDMDDSPLCVSTEQIVFPQSAESVDGQWFFVANQPNLTQGVRIETCVSENAKCKMIDGFAEGYVSVCKQKYIYRQLAAVSYQGMIEPKMFKFPSSCCCHVKFTGDTEARVMSRFGVKYENHMSPAPRKGQAFRGA